MSHSIFKFQLNCGHPLIIGGTFNISDRTASVEIYDPTNQTFSPAGSLSTARRGLSAVMPTSGPQTGKVLVIGGTTNANETNGTLLLESYDPATNTFSTLPTQLGNVGIKFHTTSLSQDGGRIFVAGGWNTGSPEIHLYNTFVGAELYLSAAGGTAPYTYSVASGDGNVHSSWLSVPTTPGTITVTVEDSDGLTKQSTYTFE